MAQDKELKIVLVGDNGTGKTCWILRADGQSYTDAYIPEMDVEFKSVTIDVGAQRVPLQLWEKVNYLLAMMFSPIAHYS
jgi:GTPase SAR1 family protein